MQPIRRHQDAFAIAGLGMRSTNAAEMVEAYSSPIAAAAYIGVE